MEGLIDKQAEITRINKELEKLRKELARCEGKLSNPDYTKKAPAAVVEKERQRADEITVMVKKFEDQLKKLSA